MLKKIFYRGSCIPWSYGVAWQEDFGNKTIGYPIGLHLIMRWLRDAWYLIAKPSEREWYTQEEISKVEKRGFNMGWSEARYAVLQGFGEVMSISDQEKLIEYIKANEYKFSPDYSKIHQ